jgi:hypothetical protein
MVVVWRDARGVRAREVEGFVEEEEGGGGGGGGGRTLLLMLELLLALLLLMAMVVVVVMMVGWTGIWTSCVCMYLWGLYVCLDV